MEAEKPKHLDLRLAACAVFSALVVLLPKIFLGLDSGYFLSLFIVGPVITLILIFIAMRVWDANRRTAAVGLIVVYGISLYGLCLKADDYRYFVRWMFDSKTYKAELLAIPSDSTSNLRHIEWDRSGFAGIANNIVYVVYDPGDRLSGAARQHSPGRFNGIPCEVFRVRRLESHWYSIDFYTDTAWDYCGQTGSMP